MLRIIRVVSCCAVIVSGLSAQPTVGSLAPATVVLRLRDSLVLQDEQVARLIDLEKAQTTALAKATAAFLRAEADVIESAASLDLVARRKALESRAKVAIDADVARVKGEKDVRAMLSARQNAAFDWPPPSSGAPLWHSLVTPVHLTLPAEQPVDSGEVRVSVTPNYADIYIDGVRRATGRKFFMLPVGKYELRLHAAGCQELAMPIEVAKGPPQLITRTLTCGK